MTKKQMMKIFQAYVENDYRASGDIYYVRDTLLAVADEYEIRELGLGWVLGDEDTKNDQ